VVPAAPPGAVLKEIALTYRGCSSAANDGPVFSKRMTGSAIWAAFDPLMA